MTRWLLLLLLPMLGIGCAADTEIVEVHDPERQITETFERIKKTGQKQGFYRITTNDGLGGGGVIIYFI